MPLQYYILFIVLVAIAIHLYLRAKYGFWYYQPVVHSYDLIRMLSSPCIIAPELPRPTRYLQRNPEVLRVYLSEAIPAREREYFMSLIRGHYLRNGDNVYEPAADNVWPHFAGHNHPCYISFYYEPAHYIASGGSDLIKDARPIGTMTTRPLTVAFSDNSLTIPIYYVEFLCVHSDHRRRGIAPQLIQTHEHHQRHANKQIAVSLFKHEDKLLQGIVPLVVYTTYGFPITRWETPRIIPPYKMSAVTKRNMPNLVDFMSQCRPQWRVFVEPATANLLALMESANLFIHVMQHLNATTAHKIVAAYFYRNSCVRLEAGQEPILSLVASLRCATIGDDLFVDGFKSSFGAIAKRHGFGFCSIENIAANGTIIVALREKIEPTVRSPCAYFFYNYIYPTVASDQIFIIC